MDLQELKRRLSDHPINVDQNHFPRRCRERDKSTAYIREQLGNGNIDRVWKNPSPASDVQYSESLIISIPQTETHHYEVVSYLKESGYVYLKTIWRVEGP